MKALVDVPYGPHGARNFLDLYLPDTPGVYPLVIAIHGGGWMGGNLEDYTWRVKDLARRGFAAATLTYRFWPDHPYPAAIDDVMRAVRFLRAAAGELGIDPARVGAFGGSAGGHLASCLGLMDPRPEADPALRGHETGVRCVVDEFGPVDFAGMMRSASADIVEGFMGAPYRGNESAYTAASPSAHVREGAPPFLIQHGTADDGSFHGSVPLEQSQELYRKLRGVGADATLQILEGEGHGFRGEAAARAWAEAVVFFTKHLVA